MKLIQDFIWKKSDQSPSVLSDATVTMARINWYDEIETETSGISIQNREREIYSFPNAIEYCGMEEFEWKWENSLAGSFIQMIEEINGKEVAVYYMRDAVNQIQSLFNSQASHIMIWPLQWDNEVKLDKITLQEVNRITKNESNKSLLSFNYNWINVLIKDIAEMKIN